MRPELLEGEGGDVAIRFRGPDFKDVVENEDLRKLWADAIVAENRAAGQELDPVVVDNTLKDWSWKPGKFEPYKREAALEKVRQWRRFPPMVRDESGKVWKPGEVDFDHYVNRVIGSQSDRIAAIEHI